MAALALTLRLLRIRALSARREWSSSAVHAVAVTAGVVLFAMILLGTYGGVRVLDAAGASGLLRSVPAWAFLIYLLTDIVIAFGQALGDLYASRDMPLLLSLPIRFPALIAAKFVLGVVQNELYVAVFLLPFVLGYLFALHAAWYAYLVMIAGLAVFPAVLYAALVVVTILALRVIPARAAKEGLWLIGAIIPTVFWVLMFYRVATINGDVATMSLPSPPAWLPSTWLGSALSSFGVGDPTAGTLWICLLALVTVAACPPALAIVSTLFRRGFSDAFAAGGRPLGDPLSAIYPRSPGMIALARKDALTFLRTPQLWFNHIGALMFVVYLLVGHAVQTPVLPLTVQLAMIQIGFVAVLGSVTPGMTALSMEHTAVWIIKNAPLPPLHVLGAKVLVAFAQTATITAVGGALLSAGYQFSFWQTIGVIAFGVLMVACAISLGVAFDTRYPSFTWDNPNAINRGPRMVIPFLSGLGMLGLCGAVLGFSRAAFHGGPTAAIVGLCGSAAFVGVALWETLGRASRNLAKLEV